MRKYGLIGYPLSHSFSKRYFTERFIAEGVTDAEYETYPLPEISQLSALLQSIPDLKGLNVTIPYKEAVLPFLDHPDEVVQKIGACNCINIQNGKLAGHNTDVYGFRRSLSTKLLPHHNQALVLGTGGASKAVCYVLDELNISWKLISRTAGQHAYSYDEISLEIYSTHMLIVNTTPLGMYPNVESLPPLQYEFLTDKHLLFDLVYNPETTAFLQQGLDHQATVLNGYDMLIFQAERSWEIWNGGY
jgi:shikimate dehydrogenase